ncbi:hypothetical protein HanRHA438_Chr16g0750241 [Helianthus annuus]|nr:hypothetical protein HanIR_Chr16g0802251 [Helianthus annuus]KAJ0835011.1 hypothetical protein HanRHA438_Chr16g0750241 [Helianthus annuus]
MKVYHSCLLFVCSWLKITRLTIFHRTETEIGSLRTYHLVSEPRWLVSFFGLVGSSSETAGDVKRIEICVFVDVEIQQLWSH